MSSSTNEYDSRPAAHRKDSRVSWLPTHLALWFCAIVFYGLGDLLTTAAVLAAGGQELNPVLNVAATFGEGLWGPVIIKLATLVVLAVIYLSNCVRHRWAIPGLLTFAGLALMTNNTIAGASL